MSEKIKYYVFAYIEELAVSIIIVLVAFSSFYLGRTSASKHAQTGVSGISVEESGLLANPAPRLNKSMLQKTVDQDVVTASGDIVASKNGKRYYYPGCSGISRISSANIVHFASAAEAEAVGLTLATNCTPR